jgi:general secretion pathway protein M
VSTAEPGTAPAVGSAGLAAAGTESPRAPAQGGQSGFATAWARLGARERQGIVLAALVLGTFVLWQGLLAPALKSLRDTPAALAALQNQTQAMRAAAAEAQALRAVPPLSTAASIAALKAATERLGAGQRLDVTGERAVLNVKDLSVSALNAWLDEARAGARARPIDMNLSRGAAGFSGSIVVALPGATP